MSMPKRVEMGWSSNVRRVEIVGMFVVIAYLDRTSQDVSCSKKVFHQVLSHPPIPAWQESEREGERAHSFTNFSLALLRSISFLKPEFCWMRVLLLSYQSFSSETVRVSGRNLHSRSGVGGRKTQLEHQEHGWTALLPVCINHSTRFCTDTLLCSFIPLFNNFVCDHQEDKQNVNASWKSWCKPTTWINGRNQQQHGLIVIKSGRRRSRRDTHSSSPRHRPPHITEHPDDVSARKAEPTTFNCKADGNPTPTIEWYKDGKKIKHTGNRSVLPSGSLFFLNVMQRVSTM